MEALNHHRLSCGPCSRDLQTRYQGRATAEHSLTQSPSLTPSGKRARYIGRMQWSLHTDDLLRSTAPELGGSREPLMQWCVPIFSETDPNNFASRLGNLALPSRTYQPRRKTPAFRHGDIRRSASGEKLKWTPLSRQYFCGFLVTVTRITVAQWDLFLGGYSLGDRTIIWLTAEYG